MNEKIMNMIDGMINKLEDMKSDMCEETVVLEHKKETPFYLYLKNSPNREYSHITFKQCGVTLLEHPFKVSQVSYDKSKITAILNNGVRLDMYQTHGEQISVTITVLLGVIKEVSFLCRQVTFIPFQKDEKDER